jgi:hypothetical protein
LALGFAVIYIYDNEDRPTYAELLGSEFAADRVRVIHVPGSNYAGGVQHHALRHFVENFMYRDGITHAAHIDIDEFIVLKRHASISDFIAEYIRDDCAGIGMSWRFFGDSHRVEASSGEPLTQRFTWCQRGADRHIKTLFAVADFVRWDTMHAIVPKSGTHIKGTDGRRIVGPFNPGGDISVLQLNHYKCKTWPEYQHIRTRGYADRSTSMRVSEQPENVRQTFDVHNRNEVEDLTAKEFYARITGQQ